MKKNKLLALALAIVSAFSVFAGCNKNDDVVKKVVRDPSDVSDIRMNEQVTLNVGLSWNADWYPAGYDHQNNPVYDLYKSAVNVNVINKFALPYDAYITQIDNGTMDGDLPDSFFADQKTINNLIKNDRIIDMKPYYDLWATKELKETMEYNDKINFAYPTRGEKLYGIPSVEDDSSRPTVWIREDWLKAVNAKNGDKKYDIVNNKRFNAEGPKSLDEFWDLAKALALEDPDGNGKKDTYGITLSKHLCNAIMPIFAAYGAYPSSYTKNADGTWSFEGINDNMKEPLFKLAEMVKLGVVNSDFYNFDGQAALQKAGNGEVGMALAPAFAPLWPLGDAVKKGGKLVGDWIAAPMYGKDGNIITPYRQPNASGYYVVRKGYEHPEVIIKMLNNMVTKDFTTPWYKGYTEISSNPSNATYLINWLPIRIDKSEVNTNRTNLYEEALKSKDANGKYDTSKIEPGDMPSWESVKMYTEKTASDYLSGWGMYKTFREGFIVARQYGTKGKYSDWQYAPTKTMLGLKNASLEKMSNEIRIGIISGKKTEKDWDTYVNGWKRGGGETILSEMKKSGK